jgi:glycosyltransferase involved in cell wall biosynthesis
MITGAGMTWHRLQLGLSTFLERRRLGAQFDVVEVPDWMAEGWLFALSRSIPLVAHVHAPIPMIARHGEWPVTRDIRWSSALEKYAVERADVITSPSQFLVDCLRDVGWLNGLGAEVIPYALDWPRWKDVVPVSETDPVVLFVGRLEPLKSPETLVTALSLIRNRLPSARAVFVGKSNAVREGLPYIEWLSTKLDGSDCCRFLGPRPRQEIFRHLSKSRLLALPSTFDNYPFAALEAMAAGRPVVVGAETGIAEVIRRTGAGSVVPSGDPKALADAILPYLQDACLAQGVGERAQAAVRQLHDPDTVAQQREAAYAKAVQRVV